MKRLVYAGVVAAGTLAAAEGLARLAPPPDPTRGIWTGAGTDAGAPGEILLNGSPWLLWELRPGDHVEKGVHVHVNQLGMRDRDRGARTRPRAMAVGDSSVYGFGVEDAEVFTARLEAALDADVVNAAVPGYSTFQSLNLLDTRGLALEPDLLLVANLWSDNNFDSFVDRELLASYAGWDGSTSHRVRTVLGWSGLFRWLDWTIRVGPEGERARKVGWQVGNGDPKIGRRRVAINDYAANLDAMAQRMLDRDGGIVFVILPNREDLRADAPDPAWEPYRRVMRETAARWGAPLVELPPVFRAAGASEDALFLDQMHPTPRGHGLVAEAVEAQLGGWPGRPLRVHAPTPRPVYADRFEGVGAEGAAQGSPGSRGAAGTKAVIRGTLAAPQYDGGSVLIDVSAPGGRALGSVRLGGPGAFVIEVAEVPAQAVFGVTLDRAGDGPGPGDPHGTIGPLAVSPGEPVALTLEGVVLER